MKKLAVFWGSVCGLLLAAFFCSLPVSASITDIVQLSVEQTVALYGDTVQSMYYTTNNTWSDCTFTYLGSTSGLAANGQGNLSNAGYSQNDINLLFGSNWVWYGCPASDLTNIKINDVSFQFRFQPSINIRGIAYFRQVLASVRNQQHGSGLDPWRSEYRAACTVSYSPSPVAVYARGLDMQSTDSAANVYFTPLPLNGRPLGEVFPNIFSSALECAFCDIYLQDLDSVTGQENTFDFTGLTYRPTRCPAVTVQQEIAENTFESTTYYLFALSCPRVTDGYVMPDISTTAPSVGDQLDDIISQGAVNQTLLQQILAKLDLIYQKNYSVNVNLDSSSIVSGIVDGIKGLFVPSQADLLNFRLNMSTLVSDTFAPFEAAQTVRDAALNRIMSASPTATIDLPLLDLRPTVDFHIPAETFTEQGYQVVDNKVKVPLKPRENEWGTFYEFVAWGIDIICTLAFVNMLLNKFNGMIVGKKVVELEDDY